MRRYTDTTIEKTLTLLNKGLSYKEVAKKTGMNEFSVNYYAVKANKSKRPQTTNSKLQKPKTKLFTEQIKQVIKVLRSLQ